MAKNSCRQRVTTQSAELRGGTVSLAGGISQPVVLAKGTKVVAHPAAGGFHVDATVDGVALRGIFVSSDQGAQRQ
jgi:hypothetical protein